MPDPDHQHPRLLLERFLPYRLNVLASFVSEALARFYSERFGIGIAEWRVMATLGDATTATATDIARQTHMHKTKVSRAVASLIKLKFVERTPNLQDAREAFLTLSRKGRAAYEELVPVAQGFAEQLVDELPDDKRAALDDVLTHLTRKASALATHQQWAKKGDGP